MISDKLPQLVLFFSTVCIWEQMEKRSRSKITQKFLGILGKGGWALLHCISSGVASFSSW